MWDVLAPIIRWPMYSPTRFIVVVLALVVGVLMLGGLNDEDPHEVGPAPSTQTPFLTASSQTTLPTTQPAAVGGGGQDPPPDTTDPGVLASDAAAAFVSAWARPDLGADSWAEQVRPLATDALWGAGLNLTNPASTPDVTVAGEPREVQLDETSAVFDVPTTGAWIRVSLDLTDGRWLVSAIEPTA